MKKVIIFTNEYYPFKGGIGRYCEEVISEIKKDFLITLVAPKYDDSLKDSHLSEGIELNLFAGRQFKYWNLPRLIYKVISIDFVKYDKVLVADWPFWLAICFVNKYIPFKKKITFSLMLHGSEVLNLKNGKAAIFPKFINIFNGVNSIFTNSQYTKDILYQNHKVPSFISTEVTYLGVSQSGDLDNTHYLNNLKREQLKILSVGRLDDRKGYDYVIKSIGLLDEEIRRNIHYTIVGNGSDDYISNLKKLSNIYDVNISILIGISDSELSSIYTDNDVFILAAKKNDKKVEGFGLVFLEAAKFGVPSIGTDVGAVKEVVKDGITGLVVNESIEDISRAIYRFYTSRDELKILSNNCIENIGNYKWSFLTKKTFRDLYE